MKRLTALYCILAVVLVFGCWPPEAEAVDVTWAWSAPDTTTLGHPIPDGYIAHYMVFFWDAAGPVLWGTAPDTTVTIAVTPGEIVKVQVAAVDVLDRQGELSLWSDDFFVDPGTPDSPQKPSVITVHW